MLKPKRGAWQVIARLTPYFTAMREAGSEADRQEQELGLSPRRLGGAAKIEQRVQRAATGSDRYPRSRACRAHGGLHDGGINHSHCNRASGEQQMQWALDFAIGSVPADERAMGAGSTA